MATLIAVAPTRRLRHSAWRIRVATAALAVLAGIATAGAATHVVCADGTNDKECQFHGGTGIQQAVDAAVSGDTIRLRAGRYSASSYKDVPYKIHTIRGFVVIDRKDLTITGEPGAILDGAIGTPTTAIIVHRSTVSIAHLTITGFRFDIEEDEIYEGHGIFAIDSRAQLTDITVSRYQKMGITGRGDSIIDATDVRILDGHVAIWLHESAYLRLTNALVRGNDSSGIAAYDNSAAHVVNCVFDGNLDDGLYTEHDAALYVTNTLLLRNKPYAVRALDRSRVWLGYSGMFGNARATTARKDARIRRGPNLILQDPRVDANYRPLADSPLSGKADPDQRLPDGTPASIGLR